MTEVPSESHNDVDIKLVVNSYVRIERFLSILFDPLQRAKDVLLWRRDKLQSLLIFVFIVGLCLVPELLLAVALQTFVFVMVCGYWVRRRSDNGAQTASKEQAKDDLKQFRLILLRMQKFLLKCCLVLSQVKDLLNWTHPPLSLLFTLLCLLQLLVLVLCGVRWFLALLPLSSVCFGTQGFYLLASIWPPSTHASPPGESLTQDLDTPADNANRSTGGAGNAYNSSLDPSKSSPRSRPGKIRQRFTGSCSSCGVAFVNLLKRKHRCTNCGNVFCGKCSIKVKRTLLGATSPAAYKESVRVCLNCSEQLRSLQEHLPASSHRHGNVQEATPPE